MSNTQVSLLHELIDALEHVNRVQEQLEIEAKKEGSENIHILNTRPSDREILTHPGVEKIAELWNVPIQIEELDANYYKHRRSCVVQGYKFQEYYDEVTDAPTNTVDLEA